MGENYNPTTKDQIILNNTAYKQLENFFTEYQTGSNPAFIVFLLGPSGCGKTSAVSHLTKNFNHDLIRDSDISTKIFQERQDENDDAFSPTMADIFQRAITDSFTKRLLLKKYLTLLRCFPSKLQESERQSMRNFWRAHEKLFQITKKPLPIIIELNDLNQENTKAYKDIFPGFWMSKIVTIQCQAVGVRSLKKTLSQFVENYRLTNFLKKDLVEELVAMCQGDLRLALNH